MRNYKRATASIFYLKFRDFKSYINLGMSLNQDGPQAVSTWQRLKYVMVEYLLTPDDPLSLISFTWDENCWKHSDGQIVLGPPHPVRGIPGLRPYRNDSHFAKASKNSSQDDGNDFSLAETGEDNSQDGENDFYLAEAGFHYSQDGGEVYVAVYDVEFEEAESSI